MSTNNQVAYQAAAFNAESATEGALDTTAAIYFTWLQAQPSSTSQLVGNAQSALLAAVTAYAKFSQGDTDDVKTLAGRMLVNMNAQSIGLNDAHTHAAPAADIPAPTAPGAAYSQAEAQSAVTAINSIRAALDGYGITL
jgi:hypothetical protein